MASISVVTPFLNAERYLEAAIDSVRQQTCQDWQLILVDDGSTDGSVTIATKAAASDGRIRLFMHEGVRGAAAARNFGIEVAEAPIVAFLDSDDDILPTKLEADLMGFYHRPEVDMIYGPTVWWYEDGSRSSWTEPMGREAGQVHPPPSLLEKVLVWNDWFVPCTCSVAVRKHAIQSVGGFDERFVLYEDQTLWGKLFCCSNVFIRAEPLARYRQHSRSISARSVRSGVGGPHGPHQARSEFLYWVEKYASEQDVLTEQLAAALRVARSPYSKNAAMGDVVWMNLRRVHRRVNQAVSKFLLQHGTR